MMMMMRCVRVTLVPIRPRSRGGRRSLRSFSPGASLRPGSLAFNPRHRRLSTPPRRSLVWNDPDDDDDDDDDDDEFQTRNEFWIERVKVDERKVLRGAVKSGGENEESRGAT